MSIDILTPWALMIIFSPNSTLTFQNRTKLAFWQQFVQ
jgi:hypothetical protein